MSDQALQHGIPVIPARLSGTEGAILDVGIVRTHTGVVHIRVAGELDARTCRTLRDRIFAELRPSGRLLLDLLAVDFLGAAGIALLLDIQSTAGHLEAQWSVVAASRTVLRPLEATGAAADLPLTSTVADGLRRVGSAVSR